MNESLRTAQLIGQANDVVAALELAHQGFREVEVHEPVAAAVVVGAAGEVLGGEVGGEVVLAERLHGGQGAAISGRRRIVYKVESFGYGRIYLKVLLYLH